MFTKTVRTASKQATICSLLVLMAACGGNNSADSSQASFTQSPSTQSSTSPKLMPVTAYGATTTIIAEHSGQCLDVRGGPTATQDGALIEQWGCSGEANQDWNLNSKGNGQYEIIARSSNKCIEPIGGGTENYTQIQQATCDGSSKQLWTVRAKPSGGRYEIINVNANRCLDVIGGPTATLEGTLTELWDCTGEANQSWALTLPQAAPVAEAKPLVAKHSGKCLDVEGRAEATQDGARILQWSCHGGADQNWTLRDMGNGFVSMIAEHSNKCLEVIGGNPNNEALIQQATCTGEPRQLWQRESMPTAGEYRFRTALTGGRCLDVRGGPTATQDGALLELWDCTGEANQSWTVGASGGGTEPPPADADGPVGQDASLYTRVFTDEFESGFNRNIWRTHLATEPDPHPGVENFEVSDGRLKIRPMSNGTSFYDRHINMDGKYDSNGYKLEDGKYFRYGYFEIAAKLPKGDSVWPAFWLYRNWEAAEEGVDEGVRGAYSEIDIMEAYGNATRWSPVDGHIFGIDNVVHVGCYQYEGDCTAHGSRPVQPVNADWQTGKDLSETTNIYGVKWEPTRITFYFNGNYTHHNDLTPLEQERFNVDLYIILRVC
jgi:hypothetical protein